MADIPKSPNRRMVIVTEGSTNPITAKTAASVVRYCSDEVVALFDSSQVGKTSGQLLEVGDDIPVIGTLDDAPDANILLIGVALAGGRLPPAWRGILLGAISRGMHIVSGMHEFLSEDPQLAEAARQHNVRIVDVRKNDEHDVAMRVGISDQCLRIQTVGNDCCVGKKVTAIEMTRALRRLDHDAKFVATGQTGIMIEGDGCPVDRVVSDFINGAVEKLVLANQHHDIIVIEGQGSLAHPQFSAVTLGLLHGAMPHGMIMCYEAGRETIHHMPNIPLISLAHLKTVYETMANLMHSSRVIGISVSTRQLDDKAADQECQRVREELELPVCDVLRHGPDELVNAILDLKSEVIE